MAQKVKITPDNLPLLVDNFLNEQGVWNEFVEFAQKEGYDIDDTISLDEQMAE